MLIHVLRKAQSLLLEEGKWRKNMPNSYHHSPSLHHTPSPSFFNISLLTFVHSFITFKRKELIILVVSHLTESQAIQLYHPHRIN